MKSILINILSAFAIFLAPIQGLLILLFLGVLFDTIIAVYKSYKLEGCKGIKSHKLFNIATKIFFYFGSTILLYMVDLYIFGSIFGVLYFLAKAITLVFVFIELKSIDETSVSMGNKSIWVIIADLVRKVGSIKKDISDADIK